MNSPLPYFRGQDKYYDKHLLNEFHPLSDNQYVFCFNEELNWFTPAYWNGFKFWFITGFLKGKQVPFVTHWKYMNPNEFYALISSQRPEE